MRTVITPIPAMAVITDTPTTTVSIRPIERAASRLSTKIPIAVVITAMISTPTEMMDRSDHWMPAGRLRSPPASAVTLCLLLASGAP